MDHAARKHAKHSASGAHRWLKCYASVSYAGGFEDETSEWSKDGTEAHELLDFALKNGYRDAREASVMADREDWPDRLEAVQIFLDHVYGILDDHPDAILYVEVSFQFPSNVDPDNAWGTLDVAIYIPSLKLLHIIDYKHGAGEAVEVVDRVYTSPKVFTLSENPQLLFYATSVWTKLTVEQWLAIDTVTLTIVQPRKPHHEGVIRSVDVTPDRLDRFIIEVDNAILAAMAPNAPFVPGKKQCRWCPGRMQCRARESHAIQTAVSTDFKSVREVGILAMPKAQDMDIARVEQILEAAPFLRTFLNDIEKFAMEYAMANGKFEKFKLVEAQARRHWEGNDQDVAAALMRLADTTDWDAVYPRQLITITDASAIVKKAFVKRYGRGKSKIAAEDANKALAALTLKESSGNLSLVPVDDGRPAVNRIAGFSNVTVLPPPDNLSEFI